MKQRLPALVLVASLIVLASGVTAAVALTAGGGVDPGPYAACVNAKTGSVRMVDVVDDGPPWPGCTAREYSISWADGFRIENYSNRNFYGEHATASTWFHQLACPEGSEPLGGGGAFLPDEPGGAQMALQSSVPTTDDDLGGLHGWEVFFVTVDGLEHTGTFQVFVTCAPAELTS